VRYKKTFHICHSSLRWNDNLVINPKIRYFLVSYIELTLKYRVGLETLGGIFTGLLDKDTSLPVQKTLTFTTAAEKIFDIPQTMVYNT